MKVKSEALSLVLMQLICVTPALAQSQQSQDWGLRHVAIETSQTITKGRQDLIVAIIDTGIDLKHPDLKDHIWSNPKEILNGKDDDGNGFIDDIHGWNFANDTRDVTDHHGHGSHISGIIARIAPNVKIMVLKYYDPTASGDKNLKNSIQAMNYAVKMHSQIINYSGGGTEKSHEEEAALKLAEINNILVIAAAGNEKSDSDKKPFYPANYNLANILSVTAIDTQSRILASSNWGQKTVDIAAPGLNILSASPGGGYKKMTGTSQATAFATGIAALVISTRHGKISLASIKKSITQVTDIESNLLNKTKFGTQVNGLRSLSVVDKGIDAFGGYIENLNEIDRALYTIP